MKLKSFLFVVGSLLTDGARANDSTFGGAGADLVPTRQQQVQMKSEDVLLTASGYEWSVQAEYVFFNPGLHSVEVQVGFPEYRCEASDSDCAQVAFRDLWTEVDGAAVQHRQGKLKKGQGWGDFLGVVWLFDVEFPPGKDVRIRHRYRLQAGRDVEGNLFTSYVTRTGRGWAGPIGSARFTVVMPPYTRAVRDPRVPGLASSAPRLVQQDGSPRVELVLQGKSWVPEGGVMFLCNASAQLPLEPLDLAKASAAGRLPVETFCDAGQDPDSMQRGLNQLYASKGYPFENSAIAREYYSGNPAFRPLALGEQRYWVRDASPLRAFSTSWFLPDESAQIKEWSTAIVRARAAGRGEQAGSVAVDAGSLAGLPLPPPPQQGPIAARELPQSARPNLAAPFAPAARELASRAEPVQVPPSTAEPTAAAARRTDSTCGCCLPGAGAPGAGWTCLSTLFGLGALRRRWKTKRTEYLDPFVTFGERRERYCRDFRRSGNPHGRASSWTQDIAESRGIRFLYPSARRQGVAGRGGGPTGAY